MAHHRSRTKDMQVIADIVSAQIRAHRARDADAIVAPYAPDALVYDLAPPLGHHGVDRDEIAAWLATWDGPVELTVRDIEISVDGALAVVTGLTRMQGEKGGTAHDIWFRSTTCLKQAADGWRIVHEHTSVPFYMDGSVRAAVDLAP